MQNQNLGRQQALGELEQMLNDLSSGMGDGLTAEVGSIAWCEAYAGARLFNSLLDYGRLMAAQLDAPDSTVYQDRWQKIFATSMTSASFKQYSSILQNQTNFPPTINNVTGFLQQLLGNIFISIQWKQELQPLATSDPASVPFGWNCPLWQLFAYVWQPRDNQDHILIPNNYYQNMVDSYRIYTQNWIPVGVQLITYQLNNRGNQNGYCNNYHPGVTDGSMNYADGVNVVSGTSGGDVLTGSTTTFTKDFFTSITYGYEQGFETAPAVIPTLTLTPPIQIVDDNNNVQTYYVKTVNSDNSLTLTTPIISNITNRTYRCLGIIADSANMLDNASFNNR